MGYKLGQCSECEKEGKFWEVLIVNRRHMLCQDHNRIRLDLQDTRPKKKPKAIPKNRFSQSFNYCTDWGFTKEMDMYLDIWNNRPHCSWFTGKPIDFHPAHFLHVLAKALNKYPHFRLYPGNIVLGTKYEHHLIDEGTASELEAYQKENPNFDIGAFYTKRDLLKLEYEELFG